MSAEHLGRRFGDFQIKSRLGEGGAGEVYIAQQLTLGREAVIKVLAQKVQASEQSANRFLREARLASRLDHPYAAHVYAFGIEDDSTLWIAMELVRGSPLNTLVKIQGPVPLARFVPFFERLCDVINAVHEQGIVHRDIKPANVMVMQRGGQWLPKLLDLGIARSAIALSSEAKEAFGDTLEVEVLTDQTSDHSGVNSMTSAADNNAVFTERLTRSESMQLTNVGSVMGTPHYMAPEQWLDASQAGAPADIYSLGILAFECLTGLPPFEGKSARSMAKAHLTAPLPALPLHLPSGLYAVLKKATAKAEGDRFESPLAFAAALREASELERVVPALPQLKEGVLANVLSQAPQPLAEAVSLLEASKTAAEAIEAAGVVTKVLCRWLGVLALAARARIGAGGGGDAPEVATLVGRLRTHGLTPAAWLSLARTLVKPFGSRHEAHLLPELVRLFFIDGVAERSALDTLAEAFETAQPTTAEESLSSLAHITLTLNDALERSSFLSDYPLVVQGTSPERWAGTRRPSRLPAAVTSALPLGDVTLIDAAGTPVLSLSPLVQCSSPSGGAPLEMFLIDGPGRHGARLVALPGPFERQDETLWAWFVTYGLMTAEGTAAVAVEKAPYKGLSTFSTEDAANYFGREREAEAFANRLRTEPFLAVVGPSGTGKSSFILAGVLPLLPPVWRPLVLRPGAAPFATLNARLATEQLPPLVSAADVEGLVKALGVERVLVLVIDQFEELVTLCQDAKMRETFAAALLKAAQHPSQRIRVVVTLRDDFLIKIQQLAAFRETLSNSLQLLGTPALDDLKRVVSQPAQRVGYGFDDPALVTRMVETVVEYPGALALLSFTASQLWELRDRHLRLMRVKTYDSLGGVGGALANHAEATLSGLSSDEQRLVREAFRHLVTAQGTRAVLSRKESLEVLGEGPLAAGVVEKLITARLLVASERLDGEVSIEIIHEALITAWPRLVSWQREDAESARLRDSLRSSARQWAERGRPGGLLWRKETLAEYRLWRQRFGGRLTQLEAAFAAASLADESRSRLIRRGLATTAFVGLAIATALIYRAYREADIASNEAKSRLQRLWQEQSRLANVARKPMEAFVFAEAAKASGASGPELDAIKSFAEFELSGFEGELARVNGRVYRARGSPDGVYYAAVTQAEVVIVRVADHSVVARIVRPGCSDAQFTADSQSMVVVCGLEFKVRDLVVLRIADQTQTVHKLEAGLFRLSPFRDGYVGRILGNAVLVIRADGSKQTLFEVPAVDGLELQGDPLGRRVYAFAGPLVHEHDAKALWAINADGGVAWRSNDGANVEVVEPDMSSDIVVFSRGSMLEAGDVAAQKLLWSNESHSGKVLSILIVNDVVYSAGEDGKLMAQNLKTGHVLFDRTITQSGLVQIIEGPDSIFVAAADGILRKVDSKTGFVLWEHHGHQGALTALLRHGDEIISGGVDGIVRRWSARYPNPSPWAQGIFRSAETTGSGTVVVTEDAVVSVPKDGGAIRTQAAPLAGRGAVGRIDEAANHAMAISCDVGALISKPDGGWVTLETNGSFSISPDGLRWVENDGTFLRVRDTATEAVIAAIDASSVGDVLLLDDGRILGTTETGDLLMWSAPSSKQASVVSRFKAHQASFAIARTANPKHVMSRSYDRSWALWQLTETGIERIAQINGLPVLPRSISLTADGSQLYVLSPSGQLWVYDTRTSIMIAALSLGVDTAWGAVNALAQTVYASSGEVISVRGMGQPSSCRLSLSLVDERLTPTPVPACE